MNKTASENSLDSRYIGYQAQNAVSVQHNGCEPILGRETDIGSKIYRWAVTMENKIASNIVWPETKIRKFLFTLWKVGMSTRIKMSSIYHYERVRIRPINPS